MCPCVIMATMRFANIMAPRQGGFGADVWASMSGCTRCVHAWRRRDGSPRLRMTRQVARQKGGALFVFPRLRVTCLCRWPHMCCLCMVLRRGHATVTLLQPWRHVRRRATVVGARVPAPVGGRLWLGVSDLAALWVHACCAQTRGRIRERSTTAMVCRGSRRPRVTMCRCCRPCMHDGG